VKASKLAATLGAVLVAVAVIVSLARGVGRRSQRNREALLDRADALAQATETARHIASLEQLRAGFLRLAASGRPSGLASWIRSRLPEGTPDRALVSVGVQDLPALGAYAATYRLSLDDVSLADAIGLLYDIHDPEAPVALTRVDLAPSVAPSRFSLVLEIVGYGIPPS
jgi:hypothetical protein